MSTLWYFFLLDYNSNYFLFRLIKFIVNISYFYSNFLICMLVGILKIFLRFQFLNHKKFNVKTVQMKPTYQYLHFSIGLLSSRHFLDLNNTFIIFISLMSDGIIIINGSYEIIILISFFELQAPYVLSIQIKHLDLCHALIYIQ